MKTIHFMAITYLGLSILTGCRPANDPHDATTSQPEESRKTVITLTAKQTAAIGLETDPVEIREIKTTIRLPGRIVPAPEREAFVTSLIGGRVEKVFVQEGDRIGKDQPVVRLTGEALGIWISDVRSAHLELEREIRLKDRGVGVSKNLQDAQLAYSAARQRLLAVGFSSPEIEKISATLEDINSMALLSPIDGIVLDRNCTRGGPVSPGDKLFYIVNLKPILVEADVFEQDLHLLHSGQEAHVTAMGDPGKVIKGTVDRIVPRIDAERRTALLLIRLPNKDETFKPGMYVTVQILTSVSSLPAVPSDVLLIEGERSYLIVTKDELTFHRVQVKVQQEGADFVPIPELASGMRVVTSGAFQIMSAMKGVEAEGE